MLTTDPRRDPLLSLPRHRHINRAAVDNMAEMRATVVLLVGTVLALKATRTLTVVIPHQTEAFGVIEAWMGFTEVRILLTMLAGVSCRADTCICCYKVFANATILARIALTFIDLCLAHISSIARLARAVKPGYHINTCTAISTWFSTAVIHVLFTVMSLPSR